MQDGKALQAGTSHYLGTNFSAAAGIKFQNKDGDQELCHTTSWGVSTRMIGGVIMTHGDDDGLRVPPTIAPWQIVILPMLRGKDDGSDEILIDYCDDLRASLADQFAFGEKIRVLVDKKHGKAAAKRWDWVRKGAPIIIEVGGRDMDNGVVSLLRRDALWAASGKPDFQAPTKADAVNSIPAMLEAVQSGLFNEARERRDANITRGVETLDQLKAFYDGKTQYPGWTEVQWSKPTGEALARVVEQLKALKLTIRNVPIDAAPVDGPCIFTGDAAVERIFVARAY